MTLFRHELRTTADEDVFPVTDLVRQDVYDSGIESGIVIIYSPHTTVGITINENADPDVKFDLLYGLNKIFPRSDPGYQQEDGNAFAHLKASTIGASETVIIEHGRLILGLWQDIYFCEFDGPRKRSFYVKVISD